MDDKQIEMARKHIGRIKNNEGHKERLRKTIAHAKETSWKDVNDIEILIKSMSIGLLEGELEEEE